LVDELDFWEIKEQVLKGRRKVVLTGMKMRHRATNSKCLMYSQRLQNVKIVQKKVWEGNRPIFERFCPLVQTSMIPSLGASGIWRR
jgi:hypothetical protein